MSHRHRLILVLALLVAATGLTAGARADSPPDYGRAFEPHPRSRPVYGISEPTDDNGQRTFVEAPNENGTTTKLFLEVWLPVARAGGPVPPPRVPTVLEVDPYYDTGKPGYYSSQQRD
jgi:hypothetical protein